MDRTTVFTKTAKGLMEATGKTSHLSRDIRAVLKEVDGRATVELLQTRLGKMSEAKLQEALETLMKDDFVREFSTAASSVAPTTARTAPPPPRAPAASGDEDLDFTSAIPSSPRVDKRAEEAAKQKAQAAAVAAEARAKAEAAARAKAAAEAAARAKAEAEAKAKAQAAARAKAEAEAKARAEAAARAKAEADARAKREAEERARKEAEEKARREADELRAKLEEERKAREEAERKAREEAERQRREAEEKARREADALRAKIEEERKAREEAERKAKEEAERQRREAEEKARREADELRAKLEEERKAREEAERKAKEEAERRAREDAERKAREDEERKAKEEAERRAREDEERNAKEESERRAREDEERKAKEEAERKAREEAERARLEAEERAKREAEDRARREAEEAQRRANEEARRKAQEAAERERREAEEKAAQQPPEPAGSALDDLVKIETDFDAVLKASAGAPQEAAKRPAGPDDLLQKAAEELERRQAEEQARAAEEKARAKAEAEAEAKRAEEEGRRKGKGQEWKKAAPVGAEEHLSSQAEAQALLDEQNAETERHFADMEKELEAEQAAAPVPKKTPEPQEPSPARKKKEAKESARAAAAAAAAQAREAELEFEPAPAPYRLRINWGKPVALGLFLLIVLGLVGVNFISFDGSIPQFEKAAGAYLQQPVKIKSLHLSLVPRPHWRMDGVSVGNEGQLKVARVNAVAELGSMFSDKKAFSSIELDSPVLGEQGLLALLFGKPAGRDFKVASIVAKNAKLESKTFILPALDAKIALGEDGAWQKIALETPDHKTSLTLKPEGDGAALEVETNAFSLPFHPSFILENFVASGQIRRGELRLKEFKGGIFDGYLSGNANLKWGAGWSLDGEISVRAMDPGKFAPALLDQGRLEGKAAYSMRAKSYDELYDAPRLEGSFDILKGNVLGIDLGRMLQGGGAGGKTAYAELTGGFVREAGRTQLRQINLVSGPVSAGGSAEVDAAKRISGRFVVELKSPVAHARANLTLSGTLQEPHFSR